MSNGYAEVSVAKAKIAVDNYNKLYKKEFKDIEDFFKDCSTKYYYENIHKFKAIKVFGITLREQITLSSFLESINSELLLTASSHDCYWLSKIFKHNYESKYPISFNKDTRTIIVDYFQEAEKILFYYSGKALCFCVESLVNVTTNDTIQVNVDLSSFINEFYEESSS